MSVPPDKMAPTAPATPTKEEKLEKILKDFEAGDTKTNHPGKNLRELLDKSPDLKARILDSVDKGHLEKFALLPAGANAGGSYNSGNKTIELPAGYLKNAHKNKGDAAELVFVMGHEIQHSFNSTVSDKAVGGFLKEIEKTAKGPGPHDHTKAVKTFIQNFREDEAGAHIGGFNAIASQVRKDNPKAGLKELYNAHPGRMDDFIDRSGKAPKFTYALKPGLTIEADMTIKTTPENVKAMGKHYFDQPPSSARIGAKGNQDYPNYYGEWAINRINEAENKALAEAKKADPKAVAPEVKLNLKDIGLNASLIDTGLKYTDSSPKKPIAPAAQDPYGGGTPFLRTEDAEKAAASLRDKGRSDRPEMRAYGTDDYRYFSPIREEFKSEEVKRIEALLEKHLKPLLDRSPTERDNLIGATACGGIVGGLKNMDMVAMSQDGKTVFVMEGKNEYTHRVPVNIAEAVKQPYAQSMAMIDQYQQQNAVAPRDPAQVEIARGPRVG